MIQSNELRIGNWIGSCLHDNLQTEIFSVLDSKTVRLGCNPLAIYKNEDINPIPLTENWHNKFGVNKNGFNNFEYELPNTISIHVKVIFTHEYVMLRQSRNHNMHEDDIIIIWNKDIKKRDMFVHEWQNLYFALTGKELDYDPNR